MNATADALMGIFGYKRVKPKKCKVCNAEFYPSNTMKQKVCSVKCSHEYAIQLRVKRSNRETKEKIKALKSIPELTRMAQVAFNAYIRYRDKGENCISCNRPLKALELGGGFDAGHYRSRGAAPHLRFNEDNCHGQCKKCNRYNSGNAVDYRIGLINRIGIEKVEALEVDNDVHKWTKQQLIDIREHYRKVLKDIKAKEVT